MGTKEKKKREVLKMNLVKKEKLPGGWVFPTNPGQN